MKTLFGAALIFSLAGVANVDAQNCILRIHLEANEGDG